MTTPDQARRQAKRARAAALTFREAVQFRTADLFEALATTIDDICDDLDRLQGRHRRNDSTGDYIGPEKVRP